MRKLAIVALLVSSTAFAQKQTQELDVQRGPAAELYIRKRPPSPEAPVLSKELKGLLETTEKKRDEKRLEAIGLLRSFLGSNPTGEVRAEGMFKLAELLWEESRRLYLIKMDDYSRALEKCSEQKGNCEQPKEPRIELAEAEKLYLELHDKYPNFRRMDLVTYLIGFAAKEDSREDDAMSRFQEVIDKYPNSPLYGDSWMMVGEHYFANSQWDKAKAAYKHIPDSAATADLALFKTAWCDWKLGSTDEAAREFKLVLDKAVEAERSGSEAQRRRSANLRDEALEYLVVVFTEDRSISAQEVFDFLASIGGEKYSRDVLIRVAESYGGQAEWERSNEAYRFLIKMDPGAIKAADYQRQIVQNWNSALDVQKAQEEIKVLLANYGPNSDWAKQQKNRDALARSLETTEEMTRVTATNIQGEAQRREKSLKQKPHDGCVTKPDDPPDILALYRDAADAYGSYLAAFGTGKNASPKAVEVRYHRADILCFRLGQIEEAGDEYLAVGKSAPVGEFHKQALLNAMGAFEAARPKDVATRKKSAPVDVKFAEAVDLYATLFPADPTIVGVIFKNGVMFYDYGEYDEAIKRFGVIVTKYPTDPNAGPAGDRILSALNKAQDFENIEFWARKLKTSNLPAFQAKDQQERLTKLIVDSIQHSGQKYADAGKYDKAASFYLRVPKEPSVDAKTAADALMNAGVMYEKAKRPEDAADVYLEVANNYGDKAPETAEKAAFTAGVVYEQALFYDRAAKAYELVLKLSGNNKSSPHVADALYNAGLLRQALGQNDKAIAHYKEYAKQFSSRKDAPDVAFNIGLVYEDAGQEGPAVTAFSDYARTYASTNKRLMEAHTRAGKLLYDLGQYKKAREEFEKSIALWKRANGAAKTEGKQWAAEARYYEGELIFRDYEKVSIDVPPRQLTGALTKKTKLLADAEKVYFSIADFQDLKWATAALYRDGQIYDIFADALTQAGSKCPQGLKADECQAYQDAINAKVVDIQDIAVARYMAGYQKAIATQNYDEYTGKIRQALGKLAADKFPPEHEARSQERTGDRPPTPDLITEIAR
ncbi:MAG TPA: tetratricopeptide repeat protein [Kofleriaceae bacterium]|jgi:tetratricopeptide (TPR) repeat protein